MKGYKIAVLSGKGGTGKTTVSSNLAKIQKSIYVDCDVEEPNGYLFLKPEVEKVKDVNVMIPSIDYDKCTLCGECTKACRFGALMRLTKKILVFDHLCHSCGACYEICPYNAIKEIPKKIGVVRVGRSDDIDFIDGKLNIGEASGVPIIKEIKDLIKETDKNVIIDSPPGTSCSVIHSVEGSDYCLLVTEPTPYGLHDLKLAVELVKELHLPFAVIINKSGESDSIIEDYCNKENISVIAKIPFKKEYAELYSKGNLLIEEDDEIRHTFENLSQRLMELIGK
ncbi:MULTISPECIES: ATP-binding protein [Thermoanaerobacterium]|uniref:Cobyrinic acid ac-diamide synthase n=2 Tax=Thermoanaerobacterium TaxID=28895 RepID=W9E827_9THEO|nr:MULTISPECIES: ATP-binding protein [Thermoanaerobacterium]AFK87362.1 Cobyrinic acid ac-diamide synthase [Thermoanaerobacterium saccharolyticum JW/SL-YS485]ETO37071.1 Cobyrinic acid ac-diamide synthase [Thermoanaerobacterium aotearoense SCUT27]